MKLLYISTVDHIIHVMLPHLDAARALGWQVDVACHITRDPAITEAHCHTLHEVPLSRNPLHPSNLLAVWKLIRLIGKEKYDIVHCHNPSGGLYGRLAATLARTKPLRVYTAHGFHFHPLGNRFTNALYRAIETFAGRYLSDAVLTINQWDYEQATTMMPAEKVHFTRGVGVSTDHFDPAKVTGEQRQAIRKELAQDTRLVVTTIGEFIPRKRHVDALSSFVLAEIDGCLNLVGHGQLQGEVMAQATHQGWMADRAIQFLGFRHDVPQILAATDILLFPPVQEGLPCSVQEALAMEVPVVAYHIRGCEDLIDASCGYLVPFGDRDAMVAALRKVASLSADERRVMGRAGRKKMVELYDRRKCVAAWLKIYEELLPKPISPASEPISPGALRSSSPRLSSQQTPSGGREITAQEESSSASLSTGGVYPSSSDEGATLGRGAAARNERAGEMGPKNPPLAGGQEG
jgi:glycosyltransferase EpsD